MKEMWDKRYAGNEYAYGVQPNDFFKEKIKGLKPGKILLPAEGEGRNAVYAASQGWDVQAFDFSSKAKEKALLLGSKMDVAIQYNVHGMEEANYENEFFDALALVYAHNPNRKSNHEHLLKFIKPGGIIILEAFSKAQISNDTGGPKDVNMLYSIEELKEDFAQLNQIDIWEEKIVLNEGPFHSGKSAVIRLIGKK